MASRSNILMGAAFLLAALVCSTLAADSEKVVSFTYKKAAELDCSEIGTKVKFFETKPNSTEPVELVSNDQVDVSESKVVFKDLRSDQIKPNYHCEADGKRLNFVKQITPFLAKPEKPSQTITQGGYAEFVCRLLYGDDKKDDVKWEWKKAGEPFEAKEGDDRIQITTETQETKLFIKNVGELDKGEYSCTLSNAYGNVTETIILRVKNPLAALWPFLAIVGEVVVLCVIILLYEKKCSKKNQHEEDNEQTQPMMRDGQNSELKKRTAKA